MQYGRYTQFFEFTIDDFKPYVSSMTKKFRSERNKVKGREVNIAVLLDFDFGRSIAKFGTEGTFDFSVDTYERGRKTPQKGSFYIIEVKFVDLKKWITKDDWQTLTLKYFREVLDVVDLKFFCSCPSFLYQGHRYQLTQLDSAIYPISIADPIWGPRHDGSGGLCKHLVGITRMLRFSAPWLLKQLREKAKLRGFIKTDVSEI